MPLPRPDRVRFDLSYRRHAGSGKHLRWRVRSRCPAQHPIERAFADEGKRAFWHEKLIGNVLPDDRVAHELERLGWQVVVLWECQAKWRELLVAALRALKQAA